MEADYINKNYDESIVICSGCGAYANALKHDQAHNCWRNEDGTYEEGGTFQ